MPDEVKDVKNVKEKDIKKLFGAAG